MHEVVGQEQTFGLDLSIGEKVRDHPSGCSHVVVQFLNSCDTHAASVKYNFVLPLGRDTDLVV